jgi:hypothetical protein
VSKLSGLLAAFAIVVFSMSPEASWAQPSPRVTPALDGLFAAFENHPVVGLSDSHGSADEGEFYNRIMRDPRFAERVGNVIVEFGGSRHQAVLDRYLAGAPVPYVELRQVWSDVVGRAPIPAVTEVSYQSFFAQVRAVNLGLPPARRIRVWLGEPSIDWTKIRRREDLERLQLKRNDIPVEILEREILAKGKKALVLYGGLHFDTLPTRPGYPPDAGLRAPIEAKHPGAFYTIRMYGGIGRCTAGFEKEMGWPSQSLIAPVRGTTVEAAITRPGCTASGPAPMAAPGTAPLSPEFAAAMQAKTQEVMSGLTSDAILFLSPVSAFRWSPMDPTIFVDPAYFQELARRYEIMTGQRANLSEWIEFGGPRPMMAPPPVAPGSARP